MPHNGFFFSEEDDDNDTIAAEEKVDTRMVNGSWSNKNQFPSQNFPQAMPEEERQVVVTDTPPRLATAVEAPSFLSVDGNGTGGLMQRSKGTGGANPTLMVPSDVNPNMRMVTPIDSGVETKKMESSNPSAVASYAALSALTRTSTPKEDGFSAGIISEVSASEMEVNLSTNQPQRRLVPFQGNSLMEETIRKPNDHAGNSFHPSAHNIKVKRFRGQNSVMDEHREGFSKPEKHNSKHPLDHSHHINVDGGSTKETSTDPKSQATTRYQHPQQQSSLPTTRLVPFTGSSLMEEVTRGAQDQRRVPTSRLVKFEGHSMMDHQRQLIKHEESQLQSNMLHHGRHKLVPYQKASNGYAALKGSDGINNESNNESPSGKVVLYNKQAAVASSVVQSKKREYYYVQYRPPTDATMARKTGLQVNTPISLWNERDKFLDS